MDLSDIKSFGLKRLNEYSDKQLNELLELGNNEKKEWSEFIDIIKVEKIRRKT